MSNQVKTFLLLLFLFIMMSIERTIARPNRQYEYEFDENRCYKNDLHVIEVCQRCAKQTKSEIVYPMCCGNVDDVYNWCDRYINFGRRP